MKSKRQAIEEVSAILQVGEAIIDATEKAAKQNADEELKFKRSLWKYTGGRKVR